MGSILGSPYFWKLPYISQNDRSFPRRSYPSAQYSSTKSEHSHQQVPSVEPKIPTSRIHKILHDPTCSRYLDLYCYSIVRSCRIFGINSLHPKPSTLVGFLVPTSRTCIDPLQAYVGVLETPQPQSQPSWPKYPESPVCFKNSYLNPQNYVE